ncbi:MAG: preprotein translocase subunit SecD, partial [Micropepsaceae bacterium]
MLQFQTWKVFAVLGVVLLGFLMAMPNFVPEAWRVAIQRNASFLPHKPVTLGLDLQGGSYVLFEAQIEVAVKDRLQGLLEDIRRGFRKDRILYNSLSVSPSALGVRVADPSKIEEARTFLRGLANPTGTSVVGITSSDFDVRIDAEGNATMTMTDSGREQIRANAMAQSVEILRKRIDPEGTKEVTIQPQGANRIIVQVPGEQNPQENIRRGSTAAKLTFHMVDESVSLSDIEAKRIPPGSKLMSEKRGNGSTAQDYPLVIKERAIISGDMLEKASGTISPESQLPIISFKFNAQGARRFADVTKNNVGKRFAAVLDDKVITAPVIRSPILGGQGIIEGDFSIEEANETAVLLNSGALFVPLKAEDQRTVGAELGKDSIEKGQYAALAGLLLVVAFMILQYRL